MNNAVIAVDLLIRSTDYMMKLQEILQRAQRENRDITDEELAAIRDQNMNKIEDLLSR